MQAQRHRPESMTILSVLAGVAFLVNAFVTALFVGALPVTLFGGTGFFGEALLGAVLWGVMALLWGWVAVSSWTASPLAWAFVLILTWVNMGLAAVSLAWNTPWEALLASVLVSAAILVYCLIPGVKEAFGFPGRQP